MIGWLAVSHGYAAASFGPLGDRVGMTHWRCYRIAQGSLARDKLQIWSQIHLPAVFWDAREHVRFPCRGLDSGKDSFDAFRHHICQGNRYTGNNPLPTLSGSTATRAYICATSVIQLSVVLLIHSLCGLKAGCKDSSILNEWLFQIHFKFPSNRSCSRNSSPMVKTPVNRELYIFHDF